MENHCNKYTDYIFVDMTSKSNNCKVENSRQQATKQQGFKRWLSENLLLICTLVGVICGASVGFALRPLKLSSTSILILSYPGELFLRILKLIILPLIISSLIAGSASLNARLNGKIAVRTLIYFLITSTLNAALGIVLALIIHPGNPRIKKGLNSSGEAKRTTSPLDSLLDLGRNIIADNIFQATFQQTYTDYVNPSIGVFNPDGNGTDVNETLERVIKFRNGTNTLGIAFFCLTFGTVLGTLGARGKPVIDFFAIIFEVVMKIVYGVIWLTPIGVSSVIIGKILSANDILYVISQLGWFIGTMLIGVFLYQLIIMQIIYLIFVRKNPYKFYFGLAEGVLTAFATASTAAALPLSFSLMDEKVKVDKRITRFVLPIGCNINMNGTAMFIAVACIFIAQMNNMQLGIAELLNVCFIATAASFSSASVPSAALVLLLMALASIDAPIQDVSMLFAIDWLVDRFRTTNNMLGDCYAAAVVEKLSAKELCAWDAAMQDYSNFHNQENNSNNHIDSEI